MPRVPAILAVLAVAALAGCGSSQPPAIPGVVRVVAGEDFWGNIASIGLAASPDLKTTVLPFILRGVSLLGINSVANTRAERLHVWERIATDLKPRHLATSAARTIPFDALPAAFPDYIAGKVLGRTLVEIG